MLSQHAVHSGCDGQNPAAALQPPTAEPASQTKGALFGQRSAAHSCASHAPQPAPAGVGGGVGDGGVGAGGVGGGVGGVGVGGGVGGAGVGGGVGGAGVGGVGGAGGAGAVPLQ